MTDRPVFEAATAVTPLGVPDEAGRSLWAAEVAEGWDILGNTNGGYLQAIASRAAAAAVGRPDPVTMTGHFLAPTGAGAATVDVEVVRVGRRFATARATVSVGDRAVLTTLGTYGDLSEPDDDAPTLVTSVPPELPDPDDCVAHEPGGGPLPPAFAGKVEMRVHPDDMGFVEGHASGRALMRGWFRLRDGEPVTSHALVCAVDAFPPTIFNANLPTGWTPTVELTAHLRRRPAPGWLACEFTSRNVTGGFLEADGLVWDADGHLVAQSRQLALVSRG